MRTFIYKRTHKGDPDKQGCFGIRDCMGKFRRFEFDAVIGIGGIGVEARTAGIDRKLNWIGIGPRKEPSRRMHDPLVTFDHFVMFDEHGKKLTDIAPKLARRMYASPGPRFLFSDRLNSVELGEIDHLLEMAEAKPPSARMPRRRSHARCEPRRC
jgi:hypothetical protein